MIEKPMVGLAQDDMEGGAGRGLEKQKGEKLACEEKELMGLNLEKK